MAISEPNRRPSMRVATRFLALVLAPAAIPSFQQAFTSHLHLWRRSLKMHDALQAGDLLPVLGHHIGNDGVLARRHLLR